MSQLFPVQDTLLRSGRAQPCKTKSPLPLTTLQLPFNAAGVNYPFLCTAEGRALLCNILSVCYCYFPKKFISLLRIMRGSVARVVLTLQASAI